MIQYVIKKYKGHHFISFEGDDIPEELIGKYVLLGEIYYTDIDGTNKTVVQFEYAICSEQDEKLVAYDFKTAERKAIVEQFIGDFIIDIKCSMLKIHGNCNSKSFDDKCVDSSVMV